MRGGLTLAAGVVFLSVGTAGFAADRDRDDPAPWHLQKVARLAHADPLGEPEKSRSDQPPTYLHLSVKFRPGLGEPKLHSFRIVNQDGQTVADLYGFHKDRSLLVFEGDWKSLKGLFLEGLKHREPLIPGVPSRPAPGSGVSRGTAAPVVVSPETKSAARPIVPPSASRPADAPVVVSRESKPSRSHEVERGPVVVDSPAMRRAATSPRRETIVEREGPGGVVGGVAHGGTVRQGRVRRGSGTSRAADRPGAAMAADGRSSDRAEGKAEGPSNERRQAMADRETGGQADNRADAKDAGTGPGAGRDGKAGNGPGADARADAADKAGTGKDSTSGKDARSATQSGSGKGTGTGAGDGGGKDAGRGADTGAGERAGNQANSGAGMGNDSGTGSGSGSSSGSGAGAGSGSGTSNGSGTGSGAGAGSGVGMGAGAGRGGAGLGVGRGRGSRSSGQAGIERSTGTSARAGASSSVDAADSDEPMLAARSIGPGGEVAGSARGGGGGGGIGGGTGLIHLREGQDALEFRPQRMILYLSCTDEMGRGRVYQVDEKGLILGLVTLPYAATGLALHREPALVAAVPRERGKIFRIDASGRVSVVLEDHPLLPQPVDVGVAANSDSIVVADNLAHILAGTAIAGRKATELRRFDLQTRDRPLMSVAVTADKHVVFATDTEPGVYRFPGSDLSARPALLPRFGGVAADTATLRWAAAQPPAQVVVYEGETPVKTLRLPAGRSLYRHGLLSFASEGKLVTAVQSGEKPEGVWLVCIETKDETAVNLFPWQKEAILDLVVGPRMPWPPYVPEKRRSLY